MSTSEDFKNQMETFLQQFTSLIPDKEQLKKLETDYNNLMDSCIFILK